MKKLFLLTIFIVIEVCISGGAIAKTSIHRSLLNSSSLFAQYRDTLKYLYDNFITQKAKYEHKELSVLLNDLHLSVKSYVPEGPSKPGGPSKAIILYFENPKIISEKSGNQMNLPFLSISFETPIPSLDVLNLFFKSQGVWSEAEKEFFGKQLVGDVGGLTPGAK